MLSEIDPFFGKGVHAADRGLNVPVRASGVAEGNDAPADSVLLRRGRGAHEVLVDLAARWKRAKD